MLYRNTQPFREMKMLAKFLSGFFVETPYEEGQDAEREETKADFDILQITSLRDLEDALKVRKAVFQKEQGVPEDVDDDGLDRQSTLFIARGWNGYRYERPIGTVRVRILMLKEEVRVAKLERLAVLPDFRRLGVGQELTLEAMDFARNRGIEYVNLHAQETAASLYERLGFERQGNPFLEANIPHISMGRSLRLHS